MTLKNFWIAFVCVLQVFLLFRCVTSTPPRAASSNFLVGNWQARWAFADSASLNLGEDLLYHMNGHFNFLESNSLELAAYGCSSCVMGKDTVSHKLQWRYTSDTLYLYNKKDQVQLSYQLQRQTDDTLYFMLMNEVELRLWRQKKP